MATATETTTEQTTTQQTTTEAKTPQTEVKRTEDLSLDKFPPELQQHIRELREENKQRRKKSETLEAQLADLNSKVSTFEKATQERQRKELEEQNKFKELAEQERARAEKLEKDSAEKLRSKDVAIIRSILRTHAHEAGIIDPDDIKTIDVRDLRVDDDGSVPGAKEAVESLKEKKPHWFKAKDGVTQDKRATTTTPSGDTARTGDDASKWSKEELARRWGNPAKL